MSPGACMWSWQSSLPCIINLVGCGVAVPPSDPWPLGYCKLQHQEAAAGWPLHMGDLGWGHWPISAEEGLSFLIYSKHVEDAHPQHCTDLSKGGTWVPTSHTAPPPAFRLPISLLHGGMTPTFPEGFLSPTSLQSRLQLWSSHHHELRGSLPINAQTLLDSVWARLESWYQASQSTDSLLANIDPFLLFFVITQTTYFPHLGDINQNIILRKNVDAFFYDAVS